MDSLFALQRVFMPTDPVLRVSLLPTSCNFSREFSIAGQTDLFSEHARQEPYETPVASPTQPSPYLRRCP